MPCSRHCPDCWADSEGYYNYEHYLRAQGKTVVDQYELTDGHTGDVLYKGRTTYNPPVRQSNPFPSPYDAPKGLPVGTGSRSARPTTVTVTPIDDPAYDRMHYDKMDWIILGTKVVATLGTLGLATFIMVKVIQFLKGVADWLGANGAAIVSTIGGILALIVVGLIALMFSGGGRGDFTFKGTGTFK
jgi:hypothetical protein